MIRHFARVAPQYRRVRELDVRMVYRVAEILRDLAQGDRPLALVDVGAGTGRYMEAVIGVLAARMALLPLAVAYDATPQMLGVRAAAPSLASRPLTGVTGLAEHLPFTAQSFDALLTFNAVHHFDLGAFLTEAARVLRPSGKMLLYTRTPEQNRTTIWGRFFPQFAERETRLYSEATLQDALDRCSAFGMVEFVPTLWTLRTSLSRLLEQARGISYSTFLFYRRREFEAALRTFEKRVRAHFRNTSAIIVRNDHLLVVATRR